MKNSSVILDIGSSTIVALIGRHGANNTFLVSGKGEISYAGFQNADFLEPENLKFVVASAISNAEISAGEKISEVIIGVPGEFCACVPKNIEIEFPKIKKINDIDIQNIFREGDSFEGEPAYVVINKSPICYVVDEIRCVIDPVGMKAKSLSGQVSYILAQKYFIETFMSIFEELKISVAGFVCSPLAECLSLFSPDVRDKYAILVDVGYITTNVAVVRGNGLLFLNSFSLGGGFVTADLAECLKTQFNEAERLKSKVLLGWNPLPNDVYNLEGDEFMQTYSAKATNEIVTDRIEMICDYILKSLDNCSYDLPEFLPIFVTGGGLNYLKGVKNILSKKLKRQVILTQPALPNMNRPDYSSEVGLLELTLNETDLFNFMID